MGQLGGDRISRVTRETVFISRLEGNHNNRIPLQAADRFSRGGVSPASEVVGRIDCLRELNISWFESLSVQDANSESDTFELSDRRKISPKVVLALRAVVMEAAIKPTNRSNKF